MLTAEALETVAQGPGLARPWHGTLRGTDPPTLNLPQLLLPHLCHQASRRLTRGQPRLLNNSTTSVGWVCKQLSFFSSLLSVFLSPCSETFGEISVSLRRQALINTLYLGGILMLWWLPGKREEEKKNLCPRSEIKDKALDNFWGC